MNFEWDETKNKTNLSKHGVDFNYAIAVFLDENRIEWEDMRKSYGENRYVTVGMIENIVYSVVYTLRKTRYRLISARGARRDEKQAYHRQIEINR